MKLYNLFEDVILEEIENRKLLSEGVSIDNVNAAIDGKYNVNILYRDYDDEAYSKRYIQVYALGKTTSGNDAIRAFQFKGGSKKGNEKYFWKIFRLDRIEGWFPTDITWDKPISDINPSTPKYNNNGDRSLSQVTHKVDVNPQPTKQIEI